LEACHKAKHNKNHWKIVKQILLVEDFNQFEKIMIKRNKELEKKSISMMLANEEERLKRFFKNDDDTGGNQENSFSDEDHGVEQEDEIDESMMLAIKLSEEQAQKDMMLN
jgi:hypothetical protein